MDNKGDERNPSGAAHIVIADDHPLFRAALRQLLSEHSSGLVEVVAEASDGKKAVELCLSLRPKLILMDVEMPNMNGIEATRQIKREAPSTIVLMLTAFEHPDYLLEAIKAGASGYALKHASAQEITSAIDKVLMGESVLDQGVARQLFEQLIDEKQQHKEPAEDLTLPPLEPLTPRELELLRLMKQGQTNQQIAQTLSISTSTVKNHVHNIIRKLEASDRVRAVALAIEHGLVAIGAVELLEACQIVAL